MEEELVRRAKNLASSAEAFLRHFNPFDLAEDKSQQWMAVHDAIKFLRAELIAHSGANAAATRHDPKLVAGLKAVISDLASRPPQLRGPFDVRDFFERAANSDKRTIAQRLRGSAPVRKWVEDGTEHGHWEDIECSIETEAAEYIDHLEGIISSLKVCISEKNKALEPFAKANTGDGLDDWVAYPNGLTVGDFRRAREAREAAT